MPRGSRAFLHSLKLLPQSNPKLIPPKLALSWEPEFKEQHHKLQKLALVQGTSIQQAWSHAETLPQLCCVNVQLF